MFAKTVLSVSFQLCIMDKSQLDKSVLSGIGGLPSKVTNEFIFRILVHAKISCHGPEKNVAQAVTQDLFKN